MRVNVYAEEMTDRIEIISKVIDGHQFTGLRIYLELPATVNGQQYQGPFIHRPGDDDSSAVTFWGKRDLRDVLAKALSALNEHYARRPTPAPAPPAPAPEDWGPEGPQRAYRNGPPHPLASVRFYPTKLVCHGHGTAWGETSCSEAYCAGAHIHLSDAEAFAIWRTRPGATDGR